MKGYCYKARKIYPKPKPFELFVEEILIPEWVGTKVQRQPFGSEEEAINYAKCLGLKKEKLIVTS